MVLFNEYPIIEGKYPNGETIFIDFKRYVCDENRLTLVYENDSDLFTLSMAKRYIDDNYIGVKVVLYMHFCPYGQSDRPMSNHMFSFKYFAQFINSLCFDKVIVYDPHSLVIECSLDRVQIEYPTPSVLNFNEYDFLFYPDNGAAKKYSEIYSYPYRYGNKKRKLDTGEIISYEIIADKNEIKDKKILIRDDLCMGGRTFKEAAKGLLKMGAKQVDLFITHLMPQAKDFYMHFSDYGITNFYTMDTLRILKEKKND